MSAANIAHVEKGNASPFNNEMSGIICMFSFDRFLDWLPTHIATSRKPPTEHCVISFNEVHMIPIAIQFELLGKRAYYKKRDTELKDQLVVHRH